MKLSSETNQPKQISDEGVTDERKQISEERATVSESPTSTAAESLELGCDDEGLIVIQTEVKQVDEDKNRVLKEEKHVARTK